MPLVAFQKLLVLGPREDLTTNIFRALIEKIVIYFLLIILKGNFFNWICKIEGYDSIFWSQLRSIDVWTKITIDLGETNILINIGVNQILLKYFGSNIKLSLIYIIDMPYALIS